MKALTKEGRQKLNEIAERHSVSAESVEALANAIVKGGGNMAQFNVAELGGNGQWMKGGMTMIGDMFNSGLKGKVEGLCSELANLVSTQVIYEEAAELKGSGEDSVSTSTWPSVFGNPTSSGSQNNFRYAYFAPAKRLVIDENGSRKIYDTKHHQISGVSQQQGGSMSYRFTSQEGRVDINSLTLISEPAEQKQETPGMAYDLSHGSSAQVADITDPSPEDIIIATIEKVNLLFERGKITEEEFKMKKQELLAKL